MYKSGHEITNTIATTTAKTTTNAVFKTKCINGPIMPQTSKAGSGTGPSFSIVTRQSTGRERIAVISRSLFRSRPREDRNIAAAVIAEVFDAPLAGDYPVLKDLNLRVQFPRPFSIEYNNCLGGLRASECSRLKSGRLGSVAVRRVLDRPQHGVRLVQDASSRNAVADARPASADCRRGLACPRRRRRKHADYYRSRSGDPDGPRRPCQCYRTRYIDTSP
jgi:hypothetical protein